MNNYAKFKSNLGMTLIEMMVTISILSILSAIAVPNMMDWVRDARLATQSDLLTTSLNNARLEAVKRRGNITFCPANDANTATTCSLTASDWSKGWLIMAGTEVVQRFIVQKGVTIDPTTVGVVTSIFNGTLGSAQSTLTFLACAKGRKQHRIDITLSGHISKSITTTTCP
jgi:type IV fimbrial biogenesis protein FimT